MIRLQSQQLAASQFDTPEELVRWMGAVQAQDYTMSKWAVGIRLKSAGLGAVDKALREGRILRTHVMRPTWHLVAAEDIRWMLRLSARRIQAANESFAKGRGMDITPDIYDQCCRIIENILEGGNSLTKQEIAEALEQRGIAIAHSPVHFMTRIMMQAETESLICSGPDKNGKVTYALFEERVPPAKELHKEEALAQLARRYFKSHSPASLNDFVWWSGLSVTDARRAVGLLGTELIAERFGPSEMFVHESCGTAPSRDTAHLLPPFDEYLISYKDRSTVMEPVHHPKAFNRWGIFYPVVLHNGRVIGNWNKTTGKKETAIGLTPFESGFDPDETTKKAATEKYKSFLSR